MRYGHAPDVHWVGSAWLKASMAAETQAMPMKPPEMKTTVTATVLQPRFPFDVCRLTGLKKSPDRDPNRVRGIGAHQLLNFTVHHKECYDVWLCVPRACCSMESLACHLRKSPSSADRGGTSSQPLNVHAVPLASK
jgi:hypothetical protein